MLLIGDLVTRNARRMPDREALVWQHQRITWSELNARINRLANTLIRLGVTPGSCVVSLLENCPEWVEMHFATAKIGAIAVPIMPRSVPPEIVHIANDVRARVILVGPDGGPSVKAALPQLGNVDTVIGVGAQTAFPVHYDRLIADSSPDEPEIQVDPDSISAVKYTSGTTGKPKGCMRSHRQLLTNTLMYLAQVPKYESDRATISSPFAAGFAVSLLNAYVAAGATTVVLPKFDALNLFQTIEKEKITLAYAILAIFDEFVRHPEIEKFDLSSLRLFTGTSGTQDTLGGMRRLRGLRNFKSRFFNAYGSTEAGGYITYHLPEDFEAELANPALASRVESIGRESLLCRIDCVDDDLKPLPQGEVGEMAVRAPSLFAGYWNQPEETAKVLRGGYLVTGDMAYKDKNGFVFLAGRKRDMIKTGGINVYPAEIESVLATHQKVTDVAVVGIPDEKWGEMVVACVVSKVRCTEEELLTFCADKLAGYKRPKAIHFMDQLPQNETGKIVKKALRDIVIAAQGKR